MLEAVGAEDPQASFSSLCFAGKGRGDGAVEGGQGVNNMSSYATMFQGAKGSKCDDGAGAAAAEHRGLPRCVNFQKMHIIRPHHHLNLERLDLPYPIDIQTQLLDSTASVISGVSFAINASDFSFTRER